MAPEQPWLESTATESCKVICNGFWMICAFKGNFMGMPFEGRQQLGYDQHKKKFVSTWIDSFGSWMSLSEGTFS